MGSPSTAREREFPVSTAMLGHLVPLKGVATEPEPAILILPDEDDGPACRICPVCGSSSTYQTMDGRWGCTQCGSSWA